MGALEGVTSWGIRASQDTFSSYLGGYLFCPHLGFSAIHIYSPDYCIVSNQEAVAPT